MEIPGFYYDSTRKKYFKIESGNSGQNRVTKDDIKVKTALDSINDYNRLDPMIHLPQTLNKQEIDFKAKYNLKEELIRSQLKSVKKQKKSDIEVIDFCGNRMQNIGVNSLIGSPETNHLFGVFTGDSGSVVYQLSVEDVFSDDFDINESKVLINAFSKSNRVVDISYSNGSKYNVLSTLVHHFPNPNTITTSFSLNVINEISEPNPSRHCYEFSEPIFSATHFDDMNILGAEKQIYVFKPSLSGDIQIIKFSENITALTTNSDGRLFIAGTNRGQLACFDIRDNYSLSKRSCLRFHDKSVIYIQCLNDSNGVIASCHNNYLCLTDLRMFNKPILQYLNHSNSCSKIKFCVDQSVDVLCSSGDDNLVRFWSISSGKLLQMYCPEMQNLLQNRKCLPISNPFYSHSWNCLKNQSKPLIFSIIGNYLNVLTNDTNY